MKVVSVYNIHVLALSILRVQPSDITSNQDSLQLQVLKIFLKGATR